jgi:RNA polymerase sigma factor (TIGR02999 family)
MADPIISATDGFEVASTVLAPTVSPNDSDALFESLYSELRQLARSRLRTLGGRTYLDTTSLVHDAYTKLAAQEGKHFATKGHFLAYCGQVMRSVIIDLVRAAQADRRGNGEVALTLNTAIMQSSADSSSFDDEAIRVNDALAQLKLVDPRLERVVELRYYAGLSDREIAEALGVSERTVSREWERARALLRAMLSL